MRLEIVFRGFPGKLLSGYMEWSTVALLQSGGKTILFDTGGTGKRVDLLPRLASLGVAPEQVDILFLSHFHSDHAYNFDLFPNAEILLHKDEIPHIEKDADPWQPRFLYDPIKKTGRLRAVGEGDYIASGASVVHLPGHTPGCMGLILEHPSMPVTILAGDAVKNIAELARGAAAMSMDQLATSTSIRKVRDIAQRVIPGHDRILNIESDRILAECSVEETIIIPPGVANPDSPRHLELKLEQTWLPIN